MQTRCVGNILLALTRRTHRCSRPTSYIVHVNLFATEDLARLPRDNSYGLHIMHPGNLPPVFWRNFQSSRVQALSTTIVGDGGPVSRYRALLAEGRLKTGDAKQEVAIASLQALHERLLKGANSSVSWKWFSKSLEAIGAFNMQNKQSPKGLYMHGGVGTGKTMLMDVFFNGIPDSLLKKRMHFHAFMLDVHLRLHRLERNPIVRLRRKDPIQLVAEQLASETELLCLDEIEVTDVADALILLRLFSVLWPRGLVLVATSNSVPEELYKGGLNRHLFVPFFSLLRKHSEVYDLDDGSGRDYRRGHHRLQLFLSQAEETSATRMDAAFAFLAGTEKVKQNTEIEVMMGRKVKIPVASGVAARFDFEELCGKALGAADYLAIVRSYHVIFIDRIPWLGDDRKENEARRLVTFIDIAYENCRLLFCTAEVPLEALFKVVEQEEGRKLEVSSMSVSGEGGSSGRSTTMIGQMEWSATGRVGASLAQLTGANSFTQVASRRTVSRLLEMSSESYLEKDHLLGRKLLHWLLEERGE